MPSITTPANGENPLGDFWKGDGNNLLTEEAKATPPVGVGGMAALKAAENYNAPTAARAYPRPQDVNWAAHPLSWLSAKFHSGPPQNYSYAMGPSALMPTTPVQGVATEQTAAPAVQPAPSPLTSLAYSYNNSLYQAFPFANPEYMGATEAPEPPEPEGETGNYSESTPQTPEDIRNVINSGQAFVARQRMTNPYVTNPVTGAVTQAKPVQALTADPLATTQEFQTPYSGNGLSGKASVTYGQPKQEAMIEGLPISEWRKRQAIKQANDEKQYAREQSVNRRDAVAKDVESGNRMSKLLGMR